MTCPDCHDRGTVLGSVPSFNPVTEVVSSRCIGWVKCTNPIHIDVKELAEELKKKWWRP